MPETELSTFDPETFLTTEIVGEMETRYTPIPDGEYSSTIDEIAIRVIDNDSGRSILLDVTHLIHDEELAENMGMERLTVRQGIWLDVSDNGAVELGPNKNVKLARLREAVGQNSGGPWNFNMLKGAGPLFVTVGHKVDDGDPTVIYNRIMKTSATPTAR